jgi:hypothetical protein
MSFRTMSFRTLPFRSALLCLLLPLAACSGGSNAMKLYPLQGPIAEADATLVIDAKARNTNETSGPIKFRLPGRVRCEGTWSSVAPKEVSRQRGVSLTLRDTGGRLGRDTKTVAGVNNGEIYAVCNDGTRVQGNFISGSGTTSGTGQATDTNGNIYKLLF